jgi:hypothetical protein
MDTGIATVILWTGSQERPEGWYFDHGEPFGGYRGTEWQLVQHFGSKSSDREGKALQVPMWFIAPFTTLPPLWFYLRQRKHRKIGFPVSPAVEKN